MERENSGGLDDDVVDGKPEARDAESTSKNQKTRKTKAHKSRSKKLFTKTKSERQVKRSVDVDDEEISDPYELRVANAEQKDAGATSGYVAKADGQSSSGMLRPDDDFAQSKDTPEVHRNTLKTVAVDNFSPRDLASVFFKKGESLLCEDPPSVLLCKSIEIGNVKKSQRGMQRDEGASHPLKDLFDEIEKDPCNSEESAPLESMPGRFIVFTTHHMYIVDASRVSYDIVYQACMLPNGELTRQYWNCSEDTVDLKIAQFLEAGKDGLRPHEQIWTGATKASLIWDGVPGPSPLNDDGTATSRAIPQHLANKDFQDGWNTLSHTEKLRHISGGPSAKRNQPLLSNVTRPFNRTDAFFTYYRRLTRSDVLDVRLDFVCATLTHVSEIPAATRGCDCAKFCCIPRWVAACLPCFGETTPPIVEEEKRRHRQVFLQLTNQRFMILDVSNIHSKLDVARIMTALMNGNKKFRVDNEALPVHQSYLEDLSQQQQQLDRILQYAKEVQDADFCAAYQDAVTRARMKPKFDRSDPVTQECISFFGGVHVMEHIASNKGIPFTLIPEFAKVMSWHYKSILEYVTSMRKENSTNFWVQNIESNPAAEKFCKFLASEWLPQDGTEHQRASAIFHTLLLRFPADFPLKVEDPPKRNKRK